MIILHVDLIIIIIIKSMILYNHQTKYKMHMHLKTKK